MPKPTPSCPKLMRKGKHKSTTEAVSLSLPINPQNINPYDYSTMMGQRTVPDTIHELRDLYIKETGNQFPDDIAKYADWMEEKLTSLNSKTIPCCPNCKTNYDVDVFNVCENCGHKWK